MYVNWKRYSIGALLMVGMGLAAGCGGGSGAPSTTITGKAVKGPVKGADVEVWTIGADGNQGLKIGSSTTSKVAGHEGEYTVSISKATGPVMVKIIPTATSTYVDESSAAGADASFNTPIRAVVPAVEAVVNTVAPAMAVTPLTEVAAQKLPTLIVASPGADVAQATRASNTFVQQTFGLSDILRVPAAFKDTNAVLSNEAKAYATLLGYVAQLVKDQGGITNAITVLQNLTSPNLAVRTAAGNNLSTAQANLLVAVTVDPSLTAAVSSTIGVAVAAAIVAPPATPDLSDKVAPTATTLSATATSTSVILTWTASSDANGVAGYYIFRNAGATPVQTTIGASTLTFVDSGLTASTKYTYTVKAFDAAGNVSAASNEVSATTLAAGAGPTLNVIVSGSVK